MKARWKTGWKMILALPLCGAYGMQGCTADMMREAANALEDQAREIDGEDREAEFGEWLADEIRDW